MQALLKKLRRLKSGYLLTGLFLLYLAFVASSCLPEVFYEVGRTFYWKTGSQELIDSVNDYYDDLLPFDQNQNPLLDKATYINLNGLMAKNLGQPLLNKRVMLKNGLLASVSETGPETEDLHYAAENLIRFCQKHQENGGHFLFVMAPSKISKYEDVLPTGYTDTDNETADRLLALLEDGNVPVLDLRETLHDAGILWEDAFFTTDHHWTPQTGFLAFQEITRTLTETGAAEAVDPLYTDEDNYTFHTFEDTFLGSAGKRTGIYFAGIDDSIFIAPDFPTDIHLTIPEMELELQGRYQDISYHLYSEMDLEYPDPFNDNMYGLYGWGDTAITHWRNDGAPVDQRILLIGDSFANVPFSLMSICYSSCDEMDMRYFEENFTDYYQEYQPQTLVLVINPNNCVSEFTCKDFLK